MTFGAYTRPIDWSLTVGRRRTRQAVPTVREFEGAQALLEAKRPSMTRADARCLLAGKAVAGIVTAVDREHCCVARPPGGVYTCTAS